MTAIDLIGRRIEDILIWEKLEENQVSVLLDRAEVFISLDNGKTICIPTFLNQEIESTPTEGAVSLFAAKKNFVQHIVHKFGFVFQNPTEKYIKCFKNQKIVDVLIFEDETALIELENAFLITEIRLAPSGLGNTGLRWYENLASFEKLWADKAYKRLTSYFSKKSS